MLVSVGGTQEHDRYSLPPSRSLDGYESAAATLRGFGIRADHLLVVRELGLRPAVDARSLVAAFYEWLDAQSFAARYFPAGVPDRVRAGQIQYWEAFLRAEVDDAYIRGRYHVGATHARIALPPKAYTTSMAFSQRWLIESARRVGYEGDKLADLIVAVSLLCQLDSALVMDAYGEHSRSRVQAEADALTEINLEITRVVSAAASGNFDERYRSTGERDARVAEAVNRMIDGLAATVRQVRAIAEGEYETALMPRSSDDELGRALAAMTARLRDATEANLRERWMRQGEADLYERMRGEQTLETLSRAVLSYLAERVGSPVGCMYVADEEGALHLSAVFGTHADSLRKTVRRGDGILGEVANKKKPVFELDVSDSPVVGHYGLGEIRLNNVIIVPMVTDDTLRAVVQFATSQPPNVQVRDFIELIAENVAISISVAQARARTEVLLVRTQAQAEEMQAQAEELRASNEELEERTEALGRARRELEDRNTRLGVEQLALEEARLELEQRAADLSVASKYKTEFLANMSHELRTPLNSMLLLTESLLQNGESNLNAKQLESLRVVRSGGEDLLRLISDILDLSKVEAGKLSLEIGTLCVADLTRSIEKQITPMVETKALRFRVDIEPSAPSNVVSDAHRVEQILRNLLSNAVKFTNEGEIRLIVRGGATPGSVRFVVKDTGIGIEASKQREIFEAFQQADGSTSRRFGGTGLGLTISRELARRLRGTIGLESTPGAGSEFSLELPALVESMLESPPRPSLNVAREATRLVPAQYSEPVLSTAFPTSVGTIAATDPPGATGGGETLGRRVAAAADLQIAAQSATRARTGLASTRSAGAREILVVEDDPIFANILADTVRAAGYLARTTSSGKDAVVLAQSYPFSGIVLDLGLPDMDGIAVLKQLKAGIRTRHIPVHVVSGHDCGPDALELGALGFLQKPVAKTALQSMFAGFERIWNRKAGRVLVVEDDAGSRAAIAELLRADDVELVLTERGEQGLEELGNSNFDCVVVDLGLPDMDGMEFLERLPIPHPPVVIYTGRDLDDAQLDQLMKRTSNVVIKGVRSPERLLDEVNLFLHQVATTLSHHQRKLLDQLHDEARVLDGRVVLLVDDDVRNLFAMTELLQTNGMSVLKAKNGKIALETLDEHPHVDLVIMDIMMPVMDGLEAMRRIRAQARFGELPIVAVTAKTLLEDRMACLEAGASDYVTKPVDPESLIALLRVLLFDSAQRVRRAS